MTDAGPDPEVPADNGRHLPVRREAVAPPRRAASRGHRRRFFTLVVAVWVAVVITVPALALRSPSGSGGAALGTAAGSRTDGSPSSDEPLTVSPTRPPVPPTTAPDPATYARLGLPVPDLFVPPPQVKPVAGTPGVDEPFETSPTTAVPPTTAPPVQVLEQVVGVDVRRSDATTTTTTAAGETEVAGSTEAGSQPRPGTLARTGLELWVLVLLGVGAVLVVIGLALVWAARRRPMQAS